MSPFLVVHIVPTGIGAAIGGFAGDATPATNALGTVADAVLTHPNVLNAATVFAPAANVAYVDGWLLDAFLASRTALQPARGNRIGLIVDQAAEADLPLILSSVGAVQAVGGVTVVGYALTEAPLNLRIALTDGDRSSGALGNPEVLLRAGDALVAAGANALAIAARLPALPEAALGRYEAGDGPDPIGGLEAVLSRTLSQHFGMPCAHAPVEAEAWIPPSGVGDARLAAETISPSYLPCVLQGLARSPQPVAVDRPGSAWHCRDVGAVVTAAGAEGGPGVLAALAAGIPVIVVGENTTVQTVHVTHPAIRRVANYWEAIGLVACLRAGIDPGSVRRPLRAVPNIT